MSDSYRVLTRKYRPRSFDDVVSQGHIISTLRNAIDQNRISHAYLFCGPRGVGKTTMARVVARMINGVSIDIDGEELGRTLDIIEIDAASNSGVDDVRNLREGVRVPPQNGKYKVYIIDEVHMLSKQAFNALLKTLEEPPEHVKFIFATTEPHKVLPTVLSRVQRFDFRRIKISEIVDRLRYICDEEKIKIDDASLHLIARKADGALRDALSLMDQAIAFCGDDIQYNMLLGALNAISNDRLFELLDCVKNRDTNAGMQIIHQLLHEGHDTQELLIAITEHVRNMYFSAFTKNGELLEVPEDEKKRLILAVSSFSEDDLLRIMHLTSEAQYKIKSSQQPRVLLEITILKLISMERSEGLNQLLAEIQELKKKTNLVGDSSLSVNPKTEKSKDQNVVAKPDKLAVSETETELPVEPKTEAKTEEKPVSKSSESLKNGAATSTTNGHNYEVSQGITEDVFGTPSIKKSAVNKVRPLDSAVSSNKLADARPLGNGTTETDLRSEPSMLTQDEDEAEKPPHPVQSANIGKRTVDKGAEQAENLKTLELITSNYSNWIEEVKISCPQLVAMSLIKTKATEIRSDIVHIECQDEFVAELIGEHAEKLGDCLEKIIHKKLTIKSVIKINKGTIASNDPYQSLKKLQDDLPVVKSIVEVLGAELEY